MEKLCDSCCHIYINTTSVGMHPNTDASPLGDAPPKFTPDTLVFDTIYNPLETKLLRDAKTAGAKTVGGIEMFVRQAAGQFETWTGKPGPARYHAPRDRIPPGIEIIIASPDRRRKVSRKPYLTAMKAREGHDVGFDTQTDAPNRRCEFDSNPFAHSNV